MAQSPRERFAESGVPIDPVYGPAPGDEAVRAKLGDPGSFPFTRHIRRDGYRSKPWSPSLYAGFGRPSEANARFRMLLEEGNGRANVAVNIPSQMGLDSDDPAAAGEVGRVGVAIDSLADFEEMFRGIPLDTVPVSLNANTSAVVMVAFLAATATRQGVPLERVTGTIANDILHEYVARGTWRYPPDGSLRLMVDLVEYCTREMPRLYPWNVRGLLLHESGASPTQEVGISFAIAARYLEEVLRRGIAIDSVAPRMSFFFGCGPHFLEEAAKFRAARRLWSRLLRDELGAQLPQSQMLRFTSVACCGSHFTAIDPELNLVRGTLGCLAVALGGGQAMLGTTIDEAYSIPTERTQHLALRSQQIVAMESDVCATVDPLGGSYFIEAMTDAIEAEARAEILRYGGSKGIVEAIVAGEPQLVLAERAYRIESERARGERPLVGVNVLQEGGQRIAVALHEPDASFEEEKCRALAEQRSGRDDSRVRRSLDTVRRVAACSDENIMSPVIEAVQAYATIGEISQALEDVFGRFKEPTGS